MALLSVLAVIAGVGFATVPKPKVMVLGTFHFANPGHDAVKVTQRDILDPDRQREVLKVVAELARYKPTKIFIEAVPERQADVDTAYAALRGGAPLTANEVQQIGFRLGKELDLPSMICVDYKSDMDFESVLKFAGANGMGDVPRRMMTILEKLGKIMSDWDRQYSVGQLLAIHNDPAFIRVGQRFYTDFLAVGKHPDYPGVDMVAGWYRRNLVIYQNVQSHLKPGDRALVIYGSGHAYYLNQLFTDNEAVEFVRPSAYLPKPPISKFPDLE